MGVRWMREQKAAHITGGAVLEWPDRDITARRPDVAASGASLPTAPLAHARTPAENRGFSTLEGEFPPETGSHLTPRWRERDPNPQSHRAFALGCRRGRTHGAHATVCSPIEPQE